MVRLSQSVLYPFGPTDHVEAHRPGDDRIPVPRLLGELDAIVGQDGVDLVRHGFEHMLQELPSRTPVRFLNELGDDELAGSVNAHEEIKLTLGGLHLGNVDVKDPDPVALEPLPFRFVALNVRQAGDTMPLQAPMQ